MWRIEKEVLVLTKKKKCRQFPLPQVKSTMRSFRNPLEDDQSVQTMNDLLFEFSQMLPEQFYSFRDGTWFTAYFHPFVTDINRYTLLARLMQIFFVLDDHTECNWGDGSRQCEGTDVLWSQVYEVRIKILSDHGDVDSSDISWFKWKPYVVQLYIALSEMCRDYSIDQTRRLLKTYCDYGKANQRETKMIEAKHKFASTDELLEVSPV